MASQGKCEHHGEDIMFVCFSEGCSESLACIECVTSVHQGHTLIKLKDYRDEGMKKIQTYLQDAKEVLPTFTVKKRILNKKISENKTMHTNAKKRIANRCEQLKGCLESIATKYKNVCDENEKKNAVILENYDKVLSSMIDDLDDQIKKFEDVVKSDIVWDIINESKALPNLEQCPDLPTTTSIDFKDGNTERNLEDTFGSVDMEEELLYGPSTPVDKTSNVGLAGNDEKHSFPFPETRQESHKENKDKSTDSTDVQGQISQSSSSSIEKASDYVTPQPQLSRFEIDADFMQLMQSPTPIFSNIYAFAGLLVYFLVNKPECISKSWKLPKSVVNFCVSPVDKTIWYHTTDNNDIYQITDDNVYNFRFATKEKPTALCMLPDSCLVVAMVGKIVVFKEKGDVQHHATNKELKLPYSPSTITYCHLTQRLAFGVTEQKPKSTIRISVADRQLRLLYKIQDEVGISLSAQSKPDDARNISENNYEIQSLSFSDDGNLVVLLENNKIIVYNQAGHFVKALALKVKNFSSFLLKAEKE